jgi:hypothetical protein
MYSPEAFQRALLARQGGQGGGDMFNPDAQLDTSRMQDILPIPGLSFDPQGTVPQLPGQDQQIDPMQLLMAILQGQ